MPTISVLMPVHNGGAYLGAAVTSVLGQSDSDLELWALDDGSDDGSHERLLEWARRDPRVKVLRLPHGGIVQALNAGLEVAVGKFVARMDADDVCRPGRFAAQRAFLESHGETVALGSAVLQVDPAGRPLGRSIPPLEHDAIVDRLRAGKGSAIVHPTLMARTEALRAVGGYREDYRHIEDLDLFWRLRERGRLANLPEILLDYRQHPASANRRHAERQRELTAAWLACEVAPTEGGVAPQLTFHRARSRGELYYEWSGQAFDHGYRRSAWIYAGKMLGVAGQKKETWTRFARLLRRSLNTRTPRT